MKNKTIGESKASEKLGNGVLTRSELYRSIFILLVVVLFILTSSMALEMWKEMNNYEVLKIKDYEIVNAHNAITAPSGNTVGIWKGKGKTNDNEPTYYIVHNGSIIGNTLEKETKIGDTITINNKTYKIKDIRFYKQDSVYDDIKNDFWKDGHEQAIFQVCVRGTDWVRVIVAER